VSRRAGRSGLAGLIGNTVTVATAGLAARGAWSALRARPPGGAQRWDRVNHRAETVTLLEGPAYAIGAATAVALAPGVPPRLKAAAVLATLGGGLFGAVDDLRESGKSKGLRGHLGELAHGRVTTGGLKVLGIGATGLLAAALVPRRTGHIGHDREGIVDLLVNGAVIAGSANLVNLFDLRPGRALKAVLLAAPVSGSSPTGRLVAVACGTAAVLLPPDLAEQSMLGDTGANAAGALLGTAAVAGLGRRGRVLTLIGLGALTLASERFSFTAVIARTPGLREFDQLGRRPQKQSRRPQKQSRRPQKQSRRPSESGSKPSDESSRPSEESRPSKEISRQPE
jgi:UDP-GlcNAc:undecaprenyl-phosphate GlcNAc-1-phosphate transferase